MTMQQTPAPARTDLPVVDPAPSAPRPYRTHGTALSVGAVAWALSMTVMGGFASPDASAFDRAVFGLGSGLFQVGLLFLLRALHRSQALGTGRVARFFVRLQSGLVALAIASTVVDAIGISDMSQVGWAVLDAFWPISMLGMFGIAIRIALAGRWTGLSRYWPLVAESWAVVTIPALGIFGPSVGVVVAIVHLLVGYTVLGQIVSRRES